MEMIKMKKRPVVGVNEPVIREMRVVLRKICQNCGKTFEEIVPPEPRDNRNCPHCGAKEGRKE